jgi:hypothetical protein
MQSDFNALNTAMVTIYVMENRYPYLTPTNPTNLA